MEQKIEPLGEVKGHGPMTFNTRMAVLFYLLDKETKELIELCDQSLKDRVKKIEHYNKQVAENMGVLLKLGVKP